MSLAHPAPATRIVRIVLPFVVSTAFIAWVLSDIDLVGVWASLTPHAAAWFVPALLVFSVVTWAIDSICLVLVIHDQHGESSLWSAARMKAASYLLGILNYALGAGAVAILLRRHTRLSLLDASSVVLLIGLFDLGSLLVAAGVGALLLGTSDIGMRLAAVLGAVCAIVLGFVVLRFPRPLGPLDRLRDLEVFRAARTVSASCLVQLGGLRGAFIACYIALAWATMNAFEMLVPWLELVVKVAVMLLVAAIPMAVAGLGPNQKVFVELFQDHAPDEVLLAASLTLSFGLIASRAIMGFVFAREYTREVYRATHEPEVHAGDEESPSA